MKPNARRERGLIEFYRQKLALMTSVPCPDCGLLLPAATDADQEARRVHYAVCPVGLQKLALKDRTAALIAQNPAHIAVAPPRTEGA